MAPQPAALESLRAGRLQLVRIGASDLPELTRMHRDPRVMATLGGLRSEESSVALLRGLEDHWEEHGFGLWTLRESATGRFAGRGGLRRVTIEGRDEVEVAYALLPEFWGQGLATEVAVASVRVGFDALELHDLVSFTLPTHAASRRVMTKAGFAYERDVGHAGLPHVLYRITAASWRRDPGDSRRSSVGSNA